MNEHTGFEQLQLYQVKWDIQNTVSHYTLWSILVICAVLFIYGTAQLPLHFNTCLNEWYHDKTTWHAVTC